MSDLKWEEKSICINGDPKSTDFILDLSCEGLHLCQCVLNYDFDRDQYVCFVDIEEEEYSMVFDGMNKPKDLDHAKYLATVFFYSKISNSIESNKELIEDTQNLVWFMESAIGKLDSFSKKEIGNAN